MTIKEHREIQETHKKHLSNNVVLSKLTDGKKGYVEIFEYTDYVFAFTVKNMVRHNKELVSMDIIIDKVYSKSHYHESKYAQTTLKRLKSEVSLSTWTNRLSERMSKVGKIKSKQRPSVISLDYDNSYTYYIYDVKFLHINKIDWSNLK